MATATFSNSVYSSAIYVASYTVLLIMHTATSVLLAVVGTETGKVGDECLIHPVSLILFLFVVIVQFFDNGALGLLREIVTLF